MHVSLVLPWLGGKYITALENRHFYCDSDPAKLVTKDLIQSPLTSMEDGSFSSDFIGF